MLNLTLIIALLIAAYIQPTPDRTKAALIYAVPVAFFVLIYQELGDNTVYLLAGAFSAVTAAVISRCSGEDKMRKGIAWICFASILINLYGFAIYHAEMEPISYNVLLSVLYVAAILVLMRGHGHARSLGDHSDRSSVRGHAYQGIQYSERDK